MCSQHSFSTLFSLLPGRMYSTHIYALAPPSKNLERRFSRTKRPESIDLTFRLQFNSGPILAFLFSSALSFSLHLHLSLRSTATRVCSIREKERDRGRNYRRRYEAIFPFLLALRLFLRTHHARFHC